MSDETMDVVNFIRSLAPIIESKIGDFKSNVISSGLLSLSLMIVIQDGNDKAEAMDTISEIWDDLSKQIELLDAKAGKENE